MRTIAWLYRLQMICVVWKTLDSVSFTLQAPLWYSYGPLSAMQVTYAIAPRLEPGVSLEISWGL